MSSSSIITGKPILSTERLDYLYTSLGKYQSRPSGSIPSSTISTGLLAFGEQYVLSYYPPHAGGQPLVTHYDSILSLFGQPNVEMNVC